MTLTPIDAERAVAAVVGSVAALWVLVWGTSLGEDTYTATAVWAFAFVVAYLALYAVEWWLTLRRLRG